MVNLIPAETKAAIVNELLDKAAHSGLSFSFTGVKHSM